MIKDTDIKELELQCVDLVSKTLVEVGTSQRRKTYSCISKSLNYDLKEDFSRLYFEDIQQPLDKELGQQRSLY